MTIILKPDKLPEWASVPQNDPNKPVPNIVEPPAGKKQQGWIYEEFPPSNWFNWLLNRNYEWAKYFNGMNQSKIHGMTIQNNTINPNTHMDILSGFCISEDLTAILVLDSPFTKDLSNVWVLGNGVGGRASAVSYSPNKWYHYFAIGDVTNKIVDFGFDDLLDASNLLADATDFSVYKYLGDVYTDGSSNIFPLINFQDPLGRLFLWYDPKLDFSANNPGIGPTLVTLSVPPDKRNTAIVCGSYLENFRNTGQYYKAYLSSTFVNDIPPGTALFDASAQFGTVIDPARNSDPGSNQFLIVTDSSSQIRYRANATSTDITLYFVTKGWYMNN
jgi:hypothetical protein